MPTVFLPTMLRPLAGGLDRVEVEGQTIREVVDQLEQLAPGIKQTLIEDGRVRPGLAFAVNGVMQSMGLLAPVPEDAEVHILPAISGG
jgi:molybdopterin converting factor small subunit